MAKDITFLLPCLNEVGTLPLVLDSVFGVVKKFKIDNFEVIVADSGSTDGSLDVVRKYKRVKLVRVPIKGYGAALHWGIRKSKGVWVLFADSDMSYHFSEIGKFRKYFTSDYDLVLGNRFKGRIQKGAMPFMNRYLGTPVLSFLIRVIYGVDCNDCNSGMRMVRRSFYDRLNMRNSGMEWASELIIRTALKNGRYKEFGLNYWKDMRRGAPHLIRWLDGWRHLKAILLLRPSALLLPVLLLILLFINFAGRNTLFGYMYLFMAFALTFSIIAASLINNALERKVPKIFFEVPFVNISIILTLVSVILVVSNSPIGSDLKLFILGLVMLFDLWVFFEETIKTHLINSLKNV